MEIKSLENTPLKTIVDAFTKSFADYFVQMPDDITYWENRFRIARLDPTLSFGMFDGDILAGFILIGVDNYDGHLTAFNTGTGILPEYRGKGIVDRLYGFAMPLFKGRGITGCSLEVIEINHKAIKVYERIGFKKSRFYRCFKGELNIFPENVRLHKVDFSDIPLEKRLYYNSWDHTDKAIELSLGYSTFEVFHNEKAIGYFVIDTATGYIPQLNIYTANKEHWHTLFNGIANLSPVVKLNNIDERNTGLIESFTVAGLDNFINQFEMQMDI